MTIVHSCWECRWERVCSIRYYLYFRHNNTCTMKDKRRVLAEKDWTEPEEGPGRPKSEALRDSRTGISYGSRANNGLWQSPDEIAVHSWWFSGQRLIQVPYLYQAIDWMRVIGSHSASGACVEWILPSSAGRYAQCACHRRCHGDDDFQQQVPAELLFRSLVVVHVGQFKMCRSGCFVTVVHSFSVNAFRTEWGCIKIHFPYQIVILSTDGWFYLHTKLSTER